MNCRHCLLPFGVMMTQQLASLLSIIVLPNALVVDGFVVVSPPPSSRHRHSSFTTTTKLRTRSTTTTLLFESTNNDDNDNDEASAMIEREKQLLELNTALMQLQSEGVPLLQCDATTVHAFQAALWTTLAQLEDNTLIPEGEGEQQESEQNTLSKTRACLVLEDIPVDALKRMVDDFVILKMQQPQMSYLPELEHVSISMVANKAGPAIVLEVENNTKEECTSTSTSNNAAAAIEKKYPTKSCKNAMTSFIQRVVLGKGSSSTTTIGLGDEGGVAEPLLYRYTSTTSVCSAMATFWTCICEIQQSADGIFQSMCLQLPGFMNDNNNNENTLSLQRFMTIVELMSRTMCLFRGDAVLSLVHYHPNYDRKHIDPNYKPAYGHLPPTSWINPMIQKYYSSSSENQQQQPLLLTDDEIYASNYQRRSPIPAVMIVKNSALSDPKIVTIPLEDDGKQVQASGLEVYCPVAIKIAKEIGMDAMQKSLDEEIKMAQEPVVGEFE